LWSGCCWLQSEWRRRNNVRIDQRQRADARPTTEIRHQHPAAEEARVHGPRVPVVEPEDPGEHGEAEPARSGESTNACAAGKRGLARSLRPTTMERVAARCYGARRRLSTRPVASLPQRPGTKCLF